MHRELKMITKKDKTLVICILTHKIIKNIYKNIWKERNTDTNYILTNLKTSTLPETKIHRKETNDQSNKIKTENTTDRATKKIDIWQNMYWRYNTPNIQIATIVI